MVCTTAARFVGPNGVEADQIKAHVLLARGEAAISRGSNLMSAAAADGAVIGSPS
jgi:hypothetical protein